MQYGFKIFSFAALLAVTSITAEAACGGGGFKPSKNSPKKGDVVYVSSTPVTQTSAASATQPVAGSTVTASQPAAPLASQPVQQTAYRNPKLESAQRDIDKAQAKLDRCVGDCEKERRKLEEAKAKYARKAAEV